MCADPDWLQRVEEELTAMIGIEIPAHLRSKISEEDVRQGARLRLLRNAKALEGRSPAEQRAYLKQAVTSELADAVDHYRTKRRHTARERSLDADNPSNSFATSLASNHTSPSGRASRLEQSARLEEALNSLPEPQRVAVQLHHLQGLTVEQTAIAMGKTKGAVAGLIARGVNRLHDSLKDE
jgi:RNA polymerase sigma-70 factor (ECF subfamily)